VSLILRYWNYRQDYVTDTDFVVYVRSLVGNNEWGMGTSQAGSFRQRHIEYCIAKYGCYSSNYPWSWSRLNGNGTYSWEGEAA
jgi:hypothetical protein